jgi:hypothetical protein
MSAITYKPEVRVNGSFHSNSLVFATREEAEQSSRELMGRWTLVTDYRAVESDQPVNWALVDGVLSAVQVAS